MMRAASANGACDEASISRGQCAHQHDTCSRCKRSPPRVLPMMVARGMVRSGSSTESAGTVADSKPRNAHSDSVAADETAWNGEMPLVIGATRRARSTHGDADDRRPRPAAGASRPWSRFAPHSRDESRSALTKVKSHTAASDATPHSRGLPSQRGDEDLEIASERHRDGGDTGPQTDPIAPRNPESGELAVGGARVRVRTARFRDRARRRAKTSAIAIAPTAVRIHAMIA